MMVLSRATTGRPEDRADATSGRQQQNSSPLFPAWLKQTAAGVSINRPSLRWVERPNRPLNPRSNRCTACARAPDASCRRWHAATRPWGWGGKGSAAGPTRPTAAKPRGRRRGLTDILVDQ
eukprot:2861726-Pleurochrysis_carterae.AAC.6